MKDRDFFRYMNSEDGKYEPDREVAYRYRGTKLTFEQKVILRAKENGRSVDSYDEEQIKGLQLESDRRVKDTRPKFKPYLNCVEGVCDYVMNHIPDSRLREALKLAMNKSSKHSYQQRAQALYDIISKELGFDDSSESLTLDQFEKMLKEGT